LEELVSSLEENGINYREIIGGEEIGLSELNSYVQGS
jgi:hypothetical protein